MIVQTSSDHSSPNLFLAVLAPATALLLTWTLLQDASPTIRGGAVVLLLLVLAALALRMSRRPLWVAYGAGTVAVLLPLLATVAARGDGATLLMHWLSVLGVGGVVVFLVSHVRDQSRRIRQLDDLKANFVALANHELRTPVTVLHSTLDTLVMDLEDGLTPPQLSFLEAARSSSGALAYLVEMMTQFETLEQAPEPGSVTTADLQTLVNSTAVELQGVFGHHGVELMIALDPDAASSNLPKPYARIVLEQLLRNAAKFNHRGGQARVRAHLEDRQLVLQIEDTGWGIAPEDQDAIFESFYQNGDLLTRPAGGLGLGLALVKLAVQRMSGSIEVASLPGEGSVFTVRLPTLLVAGNGVR